MHITSSFARPKPCHLLRESYWEDGRVKKRTLANLSALPQPVIDLLRRALRNELPAADPETAPVRVRASRQHGAASAVLALARRLDLARLLYHKRCPARSRALAMIVCRLLEPASLSRVERELGSAGQTTLAALLDLRDTSADDLHGTLDWLADRQPQIERNLARRHLKAGQLALYAISSSHVEGSGYALAERDCRPNRPQIVQGLLCTSDGCPISVQSLADPDTLSSQMARLRERFGLQRLALVGDHDVLVRAGIGEDLTSVGCDWIIPMHSETIRKLADRQLIPSDLLQTGGFASVTAPDMPGERMLVRYSPPKAAGCRRQREELLEATENAVQGLAAAYVAGEFDRDEFNRRLGELRPCQEDERFRWTFDQRTGAFRAERNLESIAAEGRLDGLCGIRTSLSREELGDEGVIAIYKKLARDQESLQSLQTTASEARSKFPWTDKRLRGHTFLCMLADYLEWHLRRRWAQLLVAAEDEAVQAEGSVRPTERGASGTEPTRRTPDEVLPVYGLRELLGNLGALTAVELEYAQLPGYAVPALSELTPLQRRAFALLEAEPHPAPSWSGPRETGI